MALSSRATPQLCIRLNDFVADTLNAGDKAQTKKLSPYALADRVVSLWRSDAKAPFCLGAPLPRIVQQATPPYHSRTDFTASGEVNDALNSGATTGAASGSLGIHHFSYAREGRDTTGFLFPLAFVVENVARAAGALAPAGTKEAPELSLLDRAFDRARRGPDGDQRRRDGRSVTNVAAGDFAQAVLVPLTATHGRGSSVQLEYSPLHTYGDVHQRFGAVLRFVANRSRWNPDNQGTKRVGE